MQLKPNVTGLSMADIKVVSSTVGEVNTALLKAMINEGLYDAKAPLNSFIQTQNITIPQNVSGIFEVSEPTLLFHAGFIELGFTPIFLPQLHASAPYVEPVYDHSMFRTSMTITRDDKVIIRNNE